MGSIDSKRLQIIRFLVSVGADTEKKISRLTIDDIVMFEKVRTEDIRLIRLLQQDIKGRNVIGFLTKGMDDENNGKVDANDEGRNKEIRISDAGGTGEDTGSSDGIAVRTKNIY